MDSPAIGRLGQVSWAMCVVCEGLAWTGHKMGYYYSYVLWVDLSRSEVST